MIIVKCDICGKEIKDRHIKIHAEVSDKPFAYADFQWCDECYRAIAKLKAVPVFNPDKK